MKKEELIKLYELDFVKKFYEEELKILLDLPDEIVKLMLDNRKRAGFIFELVKNELDLEHINIALKYANMIKDNDLLSTFVDFVLDEDLIESEYYEYVLSQCHNISDKNVLELFVQIAWNQDLLDSKYYKQILEVAKTINDYELLDKFGKIASNDALLKLDYFENIINIASRIDNFEILDNFYDIITDIDLLNSKHHEFIVNSFENISNKDLLHSFSDIFINEDLLKSEQYEYVINSVIKITDINLLNPIKDIYLYPELIESKHFEYCINLINKMKNPDLIESIYNIVCDDDLLESEYYRFVLDIAIKITNDDLLVEFGEIVSNCDLLRSKHYKSIIEIVSKVNDAELLEKYNDIICDGYFIKLNNFDQVMSNICKTTDKEVLKSFLGLSLDLLDNEQVVLLASTIQEPNILDCFEQLALSKHFKQTSLYMTTLEKISKCTDPVFVKVYVDILCNNNIYENNVFELIYNMATFTNSSNKLNNIDTIVNCEPLLKSKYFMPIMHKANKYKNIDLSIINLLNFSILSESCDKIIEQIDKILSIKNEKVIMDLLDELKTKLESKIPPILLIEKKENPFSDIEINIEKNKLINVLMKTKGENIELLLEEVSIDEEINSNTYVKIKH